MAGVFFFVAEAFAGAAFSFAVTGCATAGGLLFYGDAGGTFVAADAKNGTRLWQFNTSQRWKAGPMTYTVDGQQYIGIAAGSTILAFGLW